MPKLNVKYLAEFLGTFALVFVGAGAVVVDGHTGTSHGLAEAGKLGLVGIAIAHGLTLAAMIYAVGAISGGHFNPAITFAMWVRKRLGTEHVFGYLAAQIAGALVAALVLAMIFPDEVGLAQLGTPGLGPRISSLQGFAIEAAITFLLTVVVLSVTRSNNPAFAGVAIGGTLTGLILFAGPLTGAAANPARYLGPAIVSRNIDDIWLYLTAPLFGAALAAFVIGFAVDRADPESQGDDEEESRGSGSRRTAGSFASAAESEAVHDTHDTRDTRDERDERDQDEAPPEPVEATPGKSEPTHSEPLASEPLPSDTLRKARELYWDGDAKGAAAALVPLLATASRDGSALDDEARSLVMVIEDGCGPLAILDGYRDVLGRPVQSDVPSSAPPEAHVQTH